MFNLFQVRSWPGFQGIRHQRRVRWQSLKARRFQEWLTQVQSNRNQDITEISRRILDEFGINRWAIIEMVLKNRTKLKNRHFSVFSHSLGKLFIRWWLYWTKSLKHNIWWPSLDLNKFYLPFKCNLFKLLMLIVLDKNIKFVRVFKNCH